MNTHLAPPPPAAWDWSAVTAVCLKETQRVLGRSADAEDAAQEAAVRAWRARATCHSPATPAPWVAAIARREALRAVRGGRPEVPLDAVPEPAIVHTPEPAAAGIAAVLADLSGEDRLLVFGRYVLDLPHRELAERIGAHEGAVRVRLHRLRSRLRNRLVEE